MAIFRRSNNHNRSDAIEQGEDALPRRLQLLVVDENPTVRMVMARRLTHLNYDVAVAENGFVALNMLVARRLDAIVIDIGMALMSGITTMRKIRASGLARDACFMMITSRTDSQSAVEALKAGADDHVIKPFDFDVLDARLRHACARAEAIGALSRHNAELDARVARRAMELGETREALRDLRVDRARLVSSIQALHDEIERLSAAG